MQRNYALAKSAPSHAWLARVARTSFALRARSPCRELEGRALHCAKRNKTSPANQSIPLKIGVKTPPYENSTKEYFITNEVETHEHADFYGICCFAGTVLLQLRCNRGSAPNPAKGLLALWKPRQREAALHPPVLPSFVLNYQKKRPALRQNAVRRVLASA